MEKIDYLIYCMKIIYMVIIMNYIIIKSTNTKINETYKLLLIFSFSLFIVFFSYIIKSYFEKSLYSNIFIYLGVILCSYFVFRENIDNLLFSNIVAFSIYYISYFIAISMEFLIVCLTGLRNKIICFLIIIIIQQIIIICFFKIKRFKDGFQFLKNTNINSNLNLIIMGIGTSFLYLYILLTYDSKIIPYDDVEYISKNTEKFFYFTILYFGILMIIMIKENLVLLYKQKNINKTITYYENQIKEKDEKINNMNIEIQKISDLNHKFHNRQEALRYKIDLALNNTNIEAGEEMHLEERIKDLTDEYSNELQKIRTYSILPKTKIEELDDIFTYMKNECDKNGIEFILQINGNINYLVNNIIDEIKLKTLVGDHIRDAIIAVNSCENKYKSILIALGINDTNYEFCIYDSGIEFEIDILNKLGIEKVTTHKENGGTGTGFKTTFDTLKEVKASFILEEFNKPTDNNYTKAVKFVFDGKSEQIIKSYRENILKNELKKRYIIEKI